MIWVRSIPDYVMMTSLLHRNYIIIIGSRMQKHWYRVTSSEGERRQTLLLTTVMHLVLYTCVSIINLLLFYK